jgi:hypothetical protein
MKRLLTLFMLLAGLAAVSQTITRKVVLTKGQQFECRTGGAVRFEMKVMGLTENVLNEGSQEMVVTVDQVTDTAYLLDVKITRKTEKSVATGKNLEFDSDKPADTAHPEEWNEFIKGMSEVGQVIIDKKGFVKSRTDTAADNSDPFQITTSFKNEMDTRGKTYELLANLPSRSIQPGDSWADSTVTSNAREVIHFTLVSLTATEGKITFVQTLEVRADLSEEEKMSVTMKASGDGALSFYPETGMIKSCETVLSGAGTFSMKGLTIPLNMKMSAWSATKPR